MKNPSIAFFGTPQPYATEILEHMRSAGMLPSLIVTSPDRQQGRGMRVSAPPVKEWALAHGVPLLQPERIDDSLKLELQKKKWDAFVVAAYGKILPPWLLEMPKKGALNVHYSLLPFYRGASPVESQILAGEELVGVTIIQIDEKMDHGPILAQSAYPMPDPLPTGGELAAILAKAGGELLVETLDLWLDDAIDAQEQEHDTATYTRKFSKEDGLLDFREPDLATWRKIQAFSPSPGTFFFFTDKNGKRVRVKVNHATFSNGRLTLSRVTPEGKSKIEFREFLERYPEAQSVFGR